MMRCIYEDEKRGANNMPEQGDHFNAHVIVFKWETLTRLKCKKLKKKKFIRITYENNYNPLLPQCILM